MGSPIQLQKQIFTTWFAILIAKMVRVSWNIFQNFLDILLNSCRQHVFQNLFADHLSDVVNIPYELRFKSIRRRWSRTSLIFVILNILHLNERTLHVLLPIFTFLLPKLKKGTTLLSYSLRRLHLLLQVIIWLIIDSYNSRVDIFLSNSITLPTSNILCLFSDSEERNGLPPPFS